MPTPRTDESRDDFVGRCIPIVLDDGTADDQDQAVAICNSMWEEEQEAGKMNVDELRKDKTQASEYKTFPFIKLAVDEAKGIVESIITVFGILDEGGDISHPGSFLKTLQERADDIHVLDSHNNRSIMSALGVPLDLKEIPRSELPSTVLEGFPDATGGVYAKTQFLMDTPEGKGAFIRLRDGAVKEWSYAYDALNFDFETRQVGGKDVQVRNLRQIRLFEYSPVLWGMNQATTTLGAKGTDDGKDVSGNTRLPLAARGRAWGASAAEKRVRRWADAEEAPNPKYRQAFFWYDGDAPENFTSYKLGFADVVNGELQAIPRGIFAVAGILEGARGGADIPSADQARIRTKVNTYYARMRSEFDDDSIVAPWNKINVFTLDTLTEIDLSKKYLLMPKEQLDAQEWSILQRNLNERFGEGIFTVLSGVEDARFVELKNAPATEQAAQSSEAGPEGEPPEVGPDAKPPTSEEDRERKVKELEALKLQIEILRR